MSPKGLFSIAVGFGLMFDEEEQKACEGDVETPLSRWLLHQSGLKYLILRAIFNSTN